MPIPAHISSQSAYPLPISSPATRESHKQICLKLKVDQKTIFLWNPTQPVD